MSRTSLLNVIPIILNRSHIRSLTTSISEFVAILTSNPLTLILLASSFYKPIYKSWKYDAVNESALTLGVVGILTVLPLALYVSLSVSMPFLLITLLTTPVYPDFKKEFHNLG